MKKGPEPRSSLREKAEGLRGGAPRVTLVMDPEQLRGTEVEVSGEAYRHLFRARRLPVDAPLRLVDGQGQARWGRVSAVDRRSAMLILEGPAPSGDPSRPVTLLVAPPRSQRASWLVEKATELGAKRILFLATERSQPSGGQGWLQRLQRVAVAALEQCHGATLPRLEGPLSLGGAIAETQRAEVPHRVLLHPAVSGQPVRPEEWGETQAVAWAIGPEGGWSTQEIEELREADFRPLSLGPRILRVETAVAAALSLSSLASGT
ncbi:MAG: RsmE family RNA methyltransferase [Acidobacteriota bacterium]